MGIWLLMGWEHFHALFVILNFLSLFRWLVDIPALCSLIFEQNGIVPYKTCHSVSVTTKLKPRKVEGKKLLATHKTMHVKFLVSE